MTSLMKKQILPEGGAKNASNKETRKSRDTSQSIHDKVWNNLIRFSNQLFHLSKIGLRYLASKSE